VVTVRPADWSRDAAGAAGLDTAFEIDRVYRVEADGLSFRLVEERVDPPRRKTLLALDDELAAIRRLPFAAVAEADGRVVGLVAGAHEAWHNRLRLEHLYVAPDARSRRVGRALVETAVAHARAIGAGCLWLETQNTNAGAVDFYRRVGLHLCGLDTRFYDRASPAGEEVALFFALDLD
jgi:ribosomal protein S18 acetylase RimI-like enzyme